MPMSENELRDHLIGRGAHTRGGHSMGVGQPYNVHRLRTLQALRDRHAQDHEEEELGHTHDPMAEPLDRMEIEQQFHRDYQPRDYQPDEGRGVLVSDLIGGDPSELFKLPAKKRVQRVFNDRRRGDRRP